MSSFLCILLFICSILIASFSQIILKIGSNKKNIYINKYTIIGYSLMLISTIFTLVGYKGVELTTGAILQVLSFIFVPILSVLFLKEKINKKSIIGMIIMLLGIVIYSV